MKIAPEDGWIAWRVKSPWPLTMFEVAREEWEAARVVSDQQIGPHANVQGLFWRVIDHGKNVVPFNLK